MQEYQIDYIATTGLLEESVRTTRGPWLSDHKCLVLTGILEEPINFRRAPPPYAYRLET